LSSLWNKLRKKSVHIGVLDSSELESAESMWIHHAQRKGFSDVFEAIQHHKQNNLQNYDAKAEWNT